MSSRKVDSNVVESLVKYTLKDIDGLTSRSVKLSAQYVNKCIKKLPKHYRFLINIYLGVLEFLPTIFTGRFLSRLDDKKAQSIISFYKKFAPMFDSIERLIKSLSLMRYYDVYEDNKA